MTSKSPFIHDKALCETDYIGEGTRIWAFSHILKGAKVGANCNICDHTFIEGNVEIGNNVTVKCGVQIWDGITIENDVFIGPNVSFTNDKFPRSGHRPPSYLKTRVRSGASIGANATILPGLTIGMNAMIGAGSVVTRSVPENAIVRGNPGVIVGYVNSEKYSKESSPLFSIDKGGQSSRVKGVSIHTLPIVRDMRGDLTVGEFERHIPFRPRRFFLVFDVPSTKIRGEHAHHSCQQFLVCIRGFCSLLVDDGCNRDEFILDDNRFGVYVPPLTWGVQYKHSADALLLVFASDYYDADDYIRSYDEFLNVKRQHARSL
jgi:UDP-2-acetamido-3-amino-2,3-dideoxy-glucuronate N-acetyltransferase